MTRQDTLKERHSSAGCEKKRRITKNCKDKDDKNIRQSKNSFMMLNQSNHFPYTVITLRCFIYTTTHKIFYIVVLILFIHYLFILVWISMNIYHYFKTFLNEFGNSFVVEVYPKFKLNSYRHLCVRETEDSFLVWVPGKSCCFFVAAASSSVSRT